MAYQFNNFYELISFQAQKRAKKTALFIDDTKITYAQLKDKSDILAVFLSQQGIVKGDKVALFLRNSAEYIYAVFASAKLGAVIVPINTFLKENELSYILENSGAKCLIASTLYATVVEHSKASSLCQFVLWEGDTLVSPNFEDLRTYAGAEVPSAASSLEETAVIVYTSGTTGKPKGAMLSNKNILSNAESGRRTINVKAKDRFILFLPMFHSFTFSIGMMLPLYMGSSIVIIQSMHPFSNIFKQVLMKRVTLFFGIPDVYNALSKAKLPWYFMWFNRVRVFVSAAAALQPKTLDAMAKKFKRASLLEGYGLSEAGPAVSMNTFKKQKAGSVGTALWGYEMKIVNEEMKALPNGDIGDIIVKGDNVMQGYLNLPEATEKTIVDGWLLTGDVGYMDDEGFLFIVDRKKDLIISKGINIYPKEIEECIDSFEGVSASAVIGIVDEKSGEVPIAYIEMDENAKILDEVGLKKHMRTHLANYKIPKQIHIIEALPKNATGKVLKRVLKENLREGV